jgi:hypothetical protein
MSELISRMSSYVSIQPEAGLNQAPTASLEVSEVTDVTEPEYDEDISASWRNLKHSWTEMHGRIKTAKSELRSIGRLAMLDLDGAQASLPELRIAPPEMPADKSRSFRKRISDRADKIIAEEHASKLSRKEAKKQSRKQWRQEKIREWKTDAKWYALGVGAAALSGAGVAYLK